ncbi:FtsW/RodA/SpoVE family cell cycle protein, partial [Acinetobacter baumannii]|nr:FtsW/RodA/SpoVE family cell cycle protein [Acinetobacter baumannii]
LLDYSILIPYLILCVLGLIMVYSSTSYLLLENGQNPSASVINQSIFCVLSLIAIALLYKMKTDVLKNQRLIMAAIAVLTILLLIVVYCDKEFYGAKGWLKIA